MDINQEPNIRKVEIAKLQNSLRDKAFRMMIQILFIIGLPAFLAYWGGIFLDQAYGTGKVGTLLLLLAAIIISWTIIIRMYLKIEREMRVVDELMKKERENAK